MDTLGRGRGNQEVATAPTQAAAPGPTGAQNRAVSRAAATSFASRLEKSASSTYLSVASASFTRSCQASMDSDMDPVLRQRALCRARLFPKTDHYKALLSPLAGGAAASDPLHSLGRA